MTTSLIEGAGSARASTQIKGYIRASAGIGCVEVNKPMPTEYTLSNEDVKYIRGMIAEGIARMLVEKVAKTSAPTVDSLEPERYNPSPQKEVSS